MAFIFASDPNSLAGQRLAYDRTNIDLAQTERAAQQRAIDEYNQNQIAADRQAQEDARQQRAQQFQFQQQAASQSANQQAAATDAFRFNLGRQDEQAAAAEKKREFNVNTDLTKQQFAQSQSGNDFANLMKAIQSGDITSPDDIEATYSHLTPQQKAMASAHLAEQTRQQTQQYQSALGAAKAATDVVKPKGFFGQFQSIGEGDAMEALAKNRQLAKYLPSLQWDEDNQQFVPILRKPSVAPVVPAPLSAPPSATGAALSPAVNAAAQPGFAFPQRQTTMTVPPVTPPQMPSSAFQFGNRGAVAQVNAPVAQMSNGYKVGAIYKGGLKYLGGDPNSPVSWQQVGQ